MPFSFFLIGPQAITYFHGSVFGFCRYNTKFFCFLFNIKYVGEKTQGFPITCFFTSVDVIGKIGLPYVISYGVDTIAASIISSRIC